MKLKEIMTPNPITLKPDYTIAEVAIIFMENKIDGAPVVDENNQVIGLFTKSHIYRVITQDVDMKTRVKEIMRTENILIGHPDDEFEDIVTPYVPRLPVVDDSGVVGMLTRGDIAKAFFDSYQIISSELDAIINSTYNMIISVDGHGMIKVFNKAAERMLGLKAEDVIGRHILDVFPNSGLMNIIETGKEEPMQKIVLNNRQCVSNRSPIKKDGKIIGAVAVIHDISEVEKISKELQYVKELNEELDAIIESSFDGLYVSDGNGITVRLNKAFEMISGVNGKEFMGRNVEEIEREGIVSQSVTSLVLKKKEPVTIIQKTKAGRTTLATGTPVFDNDGNIFRVVCNVRDITELNMLKQKLEQVQELSQHYESQLKTLRLRYSDSNKLVVNSPEMKNVLETVIRVAQVDSTVLIIGESGTGKELIAETIHEYSTRKEGPFLKINCGAIPENLLESELFGYESGAFTGARKEGKPGYFELASGGTLFLDEVGELPYSLQAKLLRVLQNKEIIRIGGMSSKNVDVRIVTATNRNLLDMVQNKEFREDLYYRLNVIPINIPPLRDRREDIPNLVAYFIQLYNNKYNLTKRISPEVLDIFMEYDWPGNVRELENLIERLLVTVPGDVITKKDLPASFKNRENADITRVLVSGIMPLKDAVESVEKQILEKAYAKHFTTRQMAKVLKIDASTVVRKAAKYGISLGGHNKFH